MYTMDSKIKDLIANEEVRNRVDEVAPGLVTHPKISMFKGFSLKACSKVIPRQLNPEVLDKIQAIFDDINSRG